MQTNRIVCVVASLIFLVCSIEGTTNRRSDFGSALRFDGNQDFVALPPMKIGAPLTIELLIRPQSSGTVLEWGNSDGTQKIQIALDNNNRIQYTSTSTYAKKNKLTTTSARSSGSLTSNAWNYVVITINTNGRIQFYNQLWGLLMLTIGSDTLDFAPALVVPFRDTNYIGRDADGDYFEGDLDEIRIWKTIFSVWDMDRYRTIKGNEPTLVAWWDFNQGLGNVAQDLSTNSYHGSLGGGDIAKSPTWIPASLSGTGTCSIWAETTAKTFDSKTVQLSQPGEYWLANSENVNGFESDLVIQVQLLPTKKSASVGGLAFSTGGHTVVIDLDFSHKDYSTVTIDGTAFQGDSVELDSGTTLVKSYGKQDKHSYDIAIPYVGYIHVDADPKKQQNEVDLTIFKDEYYNEGMNGICGNYNGNSNDDTSNAIKNTYPVDSSESLFHGDPDDYPVVPPPTCDPSVQLPADIYSRARDICFNTSIIADYLNETCMFDICVTGDLTIAAISAQVTYQQCVEDYINGGSVGPNPCDTPCPAFCSFNGDCHNGTCACYRDYYGNDCSQQASFPCFQATWTAPAGAGVPGGSATIKPFVGSDDIKKHYGYSSQYLLSANTGNEVTDSSVVYLYEQRPKNQNSDPVISLVVVNDKARDGSGGIATADFTFTKGPSTSDALKGLDLTVQDDPLINFYDTRNLNNRGLLEAVWFWFGGCTSGLAVTGFPTKTDFCAYITLDDLQGIDQVLVASENLFGTQDLHSVPLNSRDTTAGTIAICGTNCSNHCGMYSNCAPCTADPQCGWCVDSNTCEYGDSSGPTSRRCTQWRYSVLEQDSRVVNTPISFPVDPANVDFYLATGNSLLNVSFYVTFPSPDVVVQEIVILQELTALWASDLSLIRGATVDVYSSILETYPNTRMGLSSFTDRPQLPNGVPASLDYVYKTNQPLTNSKSAIQKALNQLVTAHGGDDTNSQLTALVELASSEQVGWTDNARHIVVVITRSGFHEGGNYPTRQQVRDALLSRNIVPIFLTPGGSVLKKYQDLVSDLGFGYANIFSLGKMSTVFCEALNSFSTIGSSAQVIQQTKGQIISVTPSEYHGISASTRVAFHVQLKNNPNAVNDSVLVIPGFGNVNLHRVASDNPIPDCPCPKNASVDAGDHVVLRLTGTYQRGPVACAITRVPTEGRLYQYKDGKKGDPIIQDDTVCEDPGNQVIYQADTQPTQSSQTVQYKLQDNCAACSQVQTMSLIIGPPPPAAPPTVNPSKNATLDEDTKLNITLGGVGSGLYSVVTTLPDSSAGTLYYYDGNTRIAVVAAGSSSFTKIETNVVEFQPVANIFGTGLDNYLTLFTWKAARASDGVQSDNTSTVRVIVRPVNDPPIVDSDQSVSTKEDTGVVVQLTGREVWGELSPSQLNYQFIVLPHQGDIYPCSNDACTPLTFPQLVSAPLTSIFYKPRPNLNGADNFSYRANDGQLNSTAITLVSVSIAAVNDAPVPTPQSPSVPEDTETAITLAGTDAEDAPTALTAIICNWNGPGTLKDNNGNVIAIPTSNLVLSSRTVRYLAPANQYSGYPGVPTPSAVFASFTFRVRDTTGQNSASCANVNITVAEVNDPANAVSPGTVSVDEDSFQIFNLTGTDVDSFDHPLRFTICSPPSAGTLTQVSSGAVIGANTVVDTVNIVGPNSVAQVKFTPEPLQSGNNYASFTFSVDDRRTTGTPTCVPVTINVLHINHAPLAGTVAPQVVDEDANVSIQLTGSDPDGDALSYIITALPLLGSLYQADNTAQHAAVGSPLTSGQIPFTITSNSAGWVVYKPPADQNGNSFATFQFAVSDAQAQSGWSSVVVNVNPVNDAPVAFNENSTTAEDTPVVINLSPSLVGHDIDNTPGELTVVLVSSVSSGLLQKCNDAVCSSPSALNSGDNIGTGSAFVKYSPGQDYNGNDQFTFKLSDPSNAFSNVATFSLVVTPVDDAPVCQPGQSSYETDEFTEIVLTLGGNDVDGPYPLHASITYANFKGFLYQFVNNSFGDQITDDGTLITDSLFRVIYVPTLNAAKDVPFTTIQYKLDDGSESCSGSVDINVTHADSPPPVPLTTNVNGTEDQPTNFQLQATDQNDPEALFAMYVDTLPSVGLLYQFNSSVPINETDLPALVTDPSGNLRYEAPANYNGDPITSFNYTIKNLNTNQTATSTAFFYITPVNDRPTLSLYQPEGIESDPVLVRLGGDDVDIEHEGDSLTAFIISVPGIGSFFQVDANNQSIGSAIPPVAPGDRVAVTNPDFLVLYVPPPLVCGVAITTFTYQVQDSHGLFSSTADVGINMDCVNNPPVVDNTTTHFVAGSDEGVLVITFSYTDPDLSNPYLFIVNTITEFPAVGTLETNNGQPINATNPSFIGQLMVYRFPVGTSGSPYATFEFTITDTDNSTYGPFQRFIDVEQRNRPPVAVSPGLVYCNEDDASVLITLNGTDPDGDFITVTITDLPTHGALFVLLDDNSQFFIDFTPLTLFDSDFTIGWPVYYQPAPNYNSHNQPEPDSFEYTIQDSHGAEVVTRPRVSVYVRAVNDAPTFNSVSSPTATVDSTTVVSNAVLTELIVSDDSFGVLLVDISSTNAQQIYFTSNASLTMSPNTTATHIVCSGTLSQINAAIASGLVFVPVVVPSSTTGTISFSVNDQGEDTEVQDPPIPLTSQTDVTVNIVKQSAGSQSQTAAATGVVGVTAVTSMASYAAYKYLKRKNILPEEADPWENDEMFDATLDNPLYSVS